MLDRGVTLELACAPAHDRGAEASPAVDDADADIDAEADADDDASAEVVARGARMVTQVDASAAAEGTALVEALRRGQAAGLARLFDAYAPLVERLLVRLLGRDDEVQDLMQEVFLAAMQGVDSLRDPSALRGWIARIAVLRARDHLRRRARRRWLTFFAPEDVPDVAGPDSPRLAEVSRRFYALMAKLDESERTVVLLHDLEQMTLPETAAACAMSLATTKRKLRAGREALRRHALADAGLHGWLIDQGVETTRAAGGEA